MKRSSTAWDPLASEAPKTAKISVEFALITPLLMLILLGIIEFSLGIFCYNSISNAAREGRVMARCIRPTVMASARLHWLR